MNNSSNHRVTTTSAASFEFHSSYLPLFLSICALEAFLGVILNITVIFVILRHRQLRELPSSVLVLNLATADLFSSAIFLPFHALLVAKVHWITSTSNDIHRCLCVFISLSSAFSIQAITIDRYISVAYSLRYQVIVTPHKAKFGSALMWAMSVIFSIAEFIAGRLTNVLAVYQTVLGTILAATILVMFALNVRMFSISRKQVRRICVQLSAVAGARKAATRQLGLAKSARKLGLILALYVLTFGPIFISKFVLYHGELESKEFYYWMLLVPLGTSCINPLVHAFWNRHFRQIMRM